MCYKLACEWTLTFSGQSSHVEGRSMADSLAMFVVSAQFLGSNEHWKCKIGWYGEGSQDGWSRLQQCVSRIQALTGLTDYVQPDYFLRLICSCRASYQCPPQAIHSKSFLHCHHFDLGTLHDIHGVGAQQTRTLCCKMVPWLD